MIVLSNTTDRLEIVLSNTPTFQPKIVTNWRDRTSTTFVAGRTVSEGNNSTPVSISGSPASSTQRLIDNISLYNEDANPISFGILYNANGAVYPIWTGTLAGKQSLYYNEGRGWELSSSQVTPLLNNKKVPTGLLYETIDRDLCDEVNTSVLASGRLSLQAIWLPQGLTVGTIAFMSATTAAGTPTNQIFGLYDVNRNLLMGTNNGTTTAWAANSLKTLSLTSTFTTTYSGLYYLGIMVTATTVPTIKGNTARVGGQLNALAPSMGGTSNTGLTTALPATANAPAAVTTSFWGAVG